MDWICLFNMFALLNPPPSPACCQWLGLCICHEGQTWGRVHNALSPSNSSSVQSSLSMLFVSLQGLPSPCPSGLPWALITHRGHPNEVPVRLDSICPSFPHGRQELSVWKTLPFRNTLTPHLHPSGAQSCQTDANMQTLSQFSHVKKQTHISYLRPDKAYVGTVDRLSMGWESGCVCLKSTFWWNC